MAVANNAPVEFERVDWRTHSSRFYVECSTNKHRSPNQGFSSSLLLECKECKSLDNGYRTSVFSSSRPQEASTNDVAFDMNVRMVLSAHELGLRYAALKEISLYCT